MFSCILRSHECGIIFTRFRTFIWWKKTGMLKIFSLIFLLRPRLLASNSSSPTTPAFFFDLDRKGKAILAAVLEVAFLESCRLFCCHQVFNQNPAVGRFCCVAGVIFRRAERSLFEQTRQNDFVFFLFVTSLCFSSL